MAQPSRFKPPMGEDNAWWWHMAADGKLGIQQCSQCKLLRHPPRPMCGECRSLEWHAVTASGEGTISSFTVLRHPKFPGFEYPLIIILVDLAEGTRVTSQLLECEPEDVSFGMAVEMVIHEDADGFKLPMFKPASGAQ